MSDVLAITGKLGLLFALAFGPMLCALIQTASASRSRSALNALSPKVQGTRAWRNAAAYFDRRRLRLEEKNKDIIYFTLVRSLWALTFLLLILFAPILFTDWFDGIWSHANLMLAPVGIADMTHNPEAVSQAQLGSMAIVSVAVMAAYVRLMFDIVVRMNTDQFTAMQVIFTIARIGAAPLVALLSYHVLVPILTSPDQGTSWRMLVAFGCAIVAGMRPDLFLITIYEALVRWLAAMPVLKLAFADKQPSPDAGSLPEAKPLALITGLGEGPQAKLQEIDITDCQRLATMNPLVIWARTTLSLHDVMDLAARALVAVEFDAGRLATMREHGVVSIRDLEGLSDTLRAKLAVECGADPELFDARIAELLGRPVTLDLLNLMAATTLPWPAAATAPVVAEAA